MRRQNNQWEEKRSIALQNAFRFATAAAAAVAKSKKHAHAHAHAHVQKSTSALVQPAHR